VVRVRFIAHLFLLILLIFLVAVVAWKILQLCRVCFDFDPSLVVAHNVLIIELGQVLDFAVNAPIFLFVSARQLNLLNRVYFAIDPMSRLKN
jgi:hypothetical protein